MLACVQVRPGSSVAANYTSLKVIYNVKNSKDHYWASTVCVQRMLLLSYPFPDEKRYTEPLWLRYTESRMGARQGR